jgi:putative FmdB family regulatory protein
MPTYEYRCKSCGHEFEEFQTMSSEPLIKCPKCAKPTLKRLMSGGVGLIFKGSGFYETDYKKSKSSSSSSKKSKSKPDSKSESKSGPKSDSKSDSKSESKSDSKSESKSDSKQESKPDTKQDSKPSTDTSSGADK